MRFLFVGRLVSNLVLVTGVILIVRATEHNDSVSRAIACVHASVCGAQESIVPGIVLAVVGFVAGNALVLASLHGRRGVSRPQRAL